MEYLETYGYDDFFAEYASAFVKEGLSPARVIAEHKSNYIVTTMYGELPGVLSGHYRYNLDELGGSPTVGDFVMAKISDEKDRAVIQRLLPRKTAFVRRDMWKAQGTQILGANFDTIFVCMSLNKNYNVSRLERFLVLAKESKAQIAVVLTKADLCEDVDMQKEITQAICGDIPVYAVSAKNKMGLDDLAKYFAKGKTVISLGSSGVGKSTLVNAIFGQTIMDVRDIREDDDMGRHTTVHRQIILLPSGGLYMDTPGLREVGLVDAEEALLEMHGDIEQIMKSCRFGNCTHRTEPGCAVKAAIREGKLTKEQYEKYLKLKKEAAFLARKEQRKLKQKELKPVRYTPGIEME